MRRSFLHGNREIPGTPCRGSERDRSGKATSRNPDVYISGKSDDCIVPKKPPNKMAQATAEVVEGRQSTKRNGQQAATRGFFNAIDHSCLLKFPEHRIAMPDRRFDSIYPRQELYEIILHVRICAGGSG